MQSVQFGFEIVPIRLCQPRPSQKSPHSLSVGASSSGSQASRDCLATFPAQVCHCRNTDPVIRPMPSTIATSPTPKVVSDPWQNVRTSSPSSDKEIASIYISPPFLLPCSLQAARQPS